MNQHEKINYVEFGANNLEATKTFFESALGWSFEDFGPERYLPFHTGSRFSAKALKPSMLSSLS